MIVKIRTIFSYLIIILLLTQCAAKPRPGLVTPEDMPPSTKIEKVRVALVLGGGGAKGFAHLGAIEVLEENNIPIDLIVGSSAGSAVGAIYADSKDIAKTKNILFKAKNSELLDFSLYEFMQIFDKPTAPITGQAYENFIFDNMEAKNFTELKIPLVVVTADTKTGQKFVINSGPIAPAVRASSAIPPIIAPVNIYHRTLFDGGVIEPVPVKTAKEYNPKLIIAIDISSPPHKKAPNNIVDLTYKAIWISYYELARMQSGLADINIHPNLEGYEMFDDHKKEELYQLGRKAALEALPAIKQKIRKIAKK